MWVVPGTDLLILVYQDASVWFVNISGEDKAPRLLIPKTEQYASYFYQNTGFEIAFDFISEQFSNRTIYHLSTFNIAIATRIPSSVHRSVREFEVDFQVWKLEVKRDLVGNAVSLICREQLSSFREGAVRRGPYEGFKLLGDTLAYYVSSYSDHDHAIAIVNWKDASGICEVEKLPRRYIRCDPNTEFTLLPDSRILLAIQSRYTRRGCGNVSVFDWKRDLPVTTLVPDLEQTNEVLRSMDAAVSIWDTSIRGQPITANSLFSLDFMDDDELRMILTDGFYNRLVALRIMPRRLSEDQIALTFQRETEVEDGTRYDWRCRHDRAFRLIEGPKLEIVRWTWDSSENQVVGHDEGHKRNGDSDLETFSIRREGLEHLGSKACLLKMPGASMFLDNPSVGYEEEGAEEMAISVIRVGVSTSTFI